jgi:hypothetical protein
MTDSKMTIIKKPKSLMNYPITRIPLDVLELMQRSYEDLAGEACYSKRTGHLLRLLDAFFHVTGFQLSYLTLSTPSFGTAMKAFARAVLDQSVIQTSPALTRLYVRNLVNLLNKMRAEVPLLSSLVYSDATSPEAHTAWEMMKKSIDPKALRYWNGWEVQYGKGKISYLPIPLIWNSHGEEFAELIYEKYCQYAVKKMRAGHSDFTRWMTYISDNSDRWPASCLQNPLEIKRHFIGFMLYNFTQALETGCDINSRTKSHSLFIHAIEEMFIQPGIWARPFSEKLPRPAVRNIPGTYTNLKKKIDGTIIKDKLITEIPLHISDSQAIEILFKQIHTDNKLVSDWAKSLLNNAKLALVRCQTLAKSGKVITSVKHKENNLANIGAENLCETYLRKGIGHIKKHGPKIMGAVSRPEIVELLGLPSTSTFFAFQLMLVQAHPCITESFFAEFELYDKNGNISGFLKTNSGYQLVGYKDRKGSPLSEQKINLTSEQADWVKFIIDLTAVIRKELKEKGHDDWRLLFIHTGGRIDFPSRFTAKSSIRANPYIVKELMAAGSLTEKSAQQFINRVTITTTRASAAVEVYLTTNSVEDMARALGHTNYSSSLLSSYLPEPILAFFQTRWIRLFQRGIICRAMKDSPQLLEAARFNSMDELHEFLKNHALRELPEHLQNPDYLKPPRSPASTATNGEIQPDRVIVSIGTGVLTALLSLKAAIDAATPNANLCSKAIYWSRFGELVVREIEGGFNSDLQNYLQLAQQHSSASYMESLIYAPAP